MGELATASGVWFPQWVEVLAQVRLPEMRRQAYRLAVVGYQAWVSKAQWTAFSPTV